MGNISIWTPSQKLSSLSKISPCKKLRYVHREKFQWTAIRDIPSLNAQVRFASGKRTCLQKEYISSEVWVVNVMEGEKLCWFHPHRHWIWGPRSLVCCSSGNWSMFGSYLIRVWGSVSMEGGPLVRRDGLTNTPWPWGQRKYTLPWTVPLCLPTGASSII